MTGGIVIFRGLGSSGFRRVVYDTGSRRRNQTAALTLRKTPAGTLDRHAGAWPVKTDTGERPI
jgi:hypothetical protein